LALAQSFAVAATVEAYKQTNLVSDGSASAVTTDADLKNPWGVSVGPGTFFWVANQVTGTSTLYDGNGAKQSLTVTIPSAGGTDAGPTGNVFNNTSDFAVGGSPANFIFVGLDGGVTAWNGTTGTAASLVSNQHDRAVYTGAALGNSGGSNFLYAANGKAGTVDVFDKDFKLTTVTGDFSDPSLPQGLVPFNVQNVDGKLYVTYAPPEGGSAAEEGAINVFNTDGTLDHRFATGGVLDEPWGVVRAPADFGKFSGAILVGNDGNGHLHAFDDNGNVLGEFLDADGNPIINEELWGLVFGNDANGGSSKKLYFAAGINDEQGGLFGSIEPTTGTTPNPNPIPLPAMTFITPAVLAFAGWIGKRAC
jgi:uncharacterized protein (TIGR03118 family)